MTVVGLYGNAGLTAMLDVEKEEEIEFNVAQIRLHRMKESLAKEVKQTLMATKLRLTMKNVWLKMNMGKRDIVQVSKMIS